MFTSLKTLFNIYQGNFQFLNIGSYNERFLCFFWLIHNTPHDTQLIYIDME